MNIDDALQHLRELNASEETLARLEAAAKELPDVWVDEIGDGPIGSLEQMTELLNGTVGGHIGFDNLHGLIEGIRIHSEAEKQTVGGTEDEAEDWQKNLWRDREWKK